MVCILLGSGSSTFVVLKGRRGFVLVLVLFLSFGFAHFSEVQPPSFVGFVVVVCSSSVEQCRCRVVSSLFAVQPIFDEKTSVFSVRKSFMSSLFGIYVDAGTIDINANLSTLGIDEDEPLSETEKTM